MPSTLSSKPHFLVSDAAFCVPFHSHAIEASVKNIFLVRYIDAVMGRLHSNDKCEQCSFLLLKIVHLHRSAFYGVGEGFHLYIYAMPNSEFCTHWIGMEHLCLDKLPVQGMVAV